MKCHKAGRAVELLGGGGGYGYLWGRFGVSYCAGICEFGAPPVVAGLQIRKVTRPWKERVIFWTKPDLRC